MNFKDFIDENLIAEHGFSPMMVKNLQDLKCKNKKFFELSKKNNISKEIEEKYIKIDKELNDLIKLHTSIRK